jgi:hypothetical protein
VRNLEGRFLLRVAAALAIALWSGLVGALAGLGCHYVNPARYRSTGRVVVSADDGNPRDPVDRAVSLAATAKNPTTLSTAILVADLYHGQRDRSPLADLADKLPFTANITQVNSGRAAMVDVAMTYTDRDKVQRALDSVIRHMMSAEGPGRARLGAFVLDSRHASAGVRTGGFEPGASVLAGFIAGLLLHSVYAQLRLAAARSVSTLPVVR